MTNEDQLFSSDVLLSTETSTPDYLFRSATGDIEFMIFEEEMAQLNDFCVLCLSQTAQKVVELRQDLRKFEEGQEQLLDPEGGDFTIDMIMQLEQFAIPLWEDTQDFLVRAMCLILLSALLEKSLKALCIAFAPEGEKQPRQKSGQSKISTYLEFLKIRCTLSFDEPQESVDLRERCRAVRNAFAHGDWDDVRAQISQIPLRQAFAAATSLMDSIEAEAY